MPSFKYYYSVEIDKEYQMSTTEKLFSPAKVLIAAIALAVIIFPYVFLGKEIPKHDEEF